MSSPEAKTKKEIAIFRQLLSTTTVISVTNRSILLIKKPKQGGRIVQGTRQRCTLCRRREAQPYGVVGQRVALQLSRLSFGLLPSAKAFKDGWIDR